jgi:large subunit ribosomal protein L44e
VIFMKIENQINAYCPYCNKHTLHRVLNASKGTVRGLSVGTRRHNRAIKGYVGSVEAKVHSKKLAKLQKVLLKCAVCGKSVERVIGGRSKKKIEIKR